MSSSPLRIGVIGCARITKNALLDPAKVVPEAAVTAVASRDQARADAYAREHGIPRAYGSYDALLADPAIDAIYNPLPNGLHCEWTIKALEAGKDVLCEKPLASNAQEAKRMADAARATGKLLVEAFHYRYHPLAQFVEETVRSGQLGKIRSAEAAIMIPNSLFSRDDIRFQLDLAGGAAMDVGAYCINAVRHVFNEEPTVESANPTEVTPGMDGAMEARFRFPSGGEGRIRCSMIAEKLESRLVIEGERGRIVCDNPFLPQMRHRMEITLDGVTEQKTFDRTPTYTFQLRAFVKAVHERKTLTTAEDGILNMAAIDAVYRAAGMPVRGT
jgi:predicted dehydrogenase